MESDRERSNEGSPGKLVGEYLKLRDAGDPDAATKILARVRGFVRREVEKQIALYEELEDIGRLGREGPNQDGPIE